MNRISNLLRLVMLICVLSIGAILVQAQKGTYSTTLKAGLSTPILDNGFGIQIGANPCYMLGRYFGIEGQVSYMFTRVTGSFVNGNMGNRHTISTLAGARVYFRLSRKKVRPYLNLLLGASYVPDLKDDLGSEGLFRGISLGGHLDIKNRNIGLAIESVGNFILKFGYRF